MRNNCKSYSLIQPGDRFYKLTTIRVYREKPKVWRMECLCDCGNVTHPIVGNVTKGITKSCGCSKLEYQRLLKKRTAETALTRNTWRNMIRRCESPSCDKYKYYGGRGIKICERWRASFESFVADMGLRPCSSHTLDRIDNDGDYCVENCRWALPIQQARNKRNTTRLLVDDQLKPLTEIAESVGLPPHVIHGRLHLGWSIEDATTKRKTRYKTFTIDGKELLLKDACELYRIPYGTVYTRIVRGWDVESAIKTPRKWSRKIGV